ncbi:PilZ domain-containing protein [Thermodesulfobacteriota bacterium]
MITIKKKKKRAHNTRSEPRIVVNADIKGTLSVLTKIKLMDISNKGALVMTPQRLSVGSIFKVKFSHSDTSENSITLRCKVLRCGFTKTIFGDDGEPIPLYLVGFRFIELNTELIKELKMFIAKEEIILNKAKEM